MKSLILIFGLLLPCLSNFAQELDSLLKDSKKIPGARAFFAVMPNKTSIYEGECVVFDMGFAVSENNRARLQFHELGKQLYREGILTKLFASNNQALNQTIQNSIVELEGVPKVIGDETFTWYRIYNGGFCATQPGIIKFPQLKLKMAVHGLEKPGTQLVDFYSRPFSITVNPLPDGALPDYNRKKYVGSFLMADSIMSTKVVVGNPVNYSVTIFGDGSAFNFSPPALSLKNVTWDLIDILDSDTLIDEQHFTRREFIYRLTFTAPGSYDFKDQITFDFFDPASEMKRSLSAGSVVDAVEGTIADKPDEFYRDNYIAIDASTSMEVEDYPPYRLRAVTTAVKGFLSRRKVCDIGLILFGENAVHWKKKKNECYSAAEIDSIQTGLVKNGTAIGRATWLAIGSFKQSPSPKKIVIIGDGDNTAGYFDPQTFSEVAKRNNIKIFTIGVGSKGLAPYGKDKDGKPYMLENTFFEGDFKKLSAATGGQYYWAKNQQEIERILELIFKL